MPGWIRRASLLLLLMLLVACPCLAVDFSLIWYTVDGGGGGILTGSGYELSATTGQFDIGSMSGGGYTLQLGSSGSGPIVTAVDPPRNLHRPWPACTHLGGRGDDGGWTEPKNMGPVINTKELEFCPMVSPDERWLSFSRRYGASWPTTTDAEIHWMDASIIEELSVDR